MGASIGAERLKTLRGRLFVAVLAAIVVSVALTVAIGAALTRRTADDNVRAGLARRADALAAQEQRRPSYIAENYLVGSVRVVVDRRADMKAWGVAPDRAANGSLTREGTRYIYSYRPIGQRGLLVLERFSRPPAWGSFVRGLLIAGAVGAILAAAISFIVAGSIVRPIRRVAAASRALAEGASPELKTPLTAIRGYAEGLGDGVFSAEAASQTILLEARRLERLVRDLLDLARMNRHEFEVRREPVDLADVAHEAVARHEAAAGEFGVALAAEGAESWVKADYDRLLQVASNLVENALRETPRGGSVTVRAEPGRLVVADTGPGLDPGDVAHAFDRFFLYDKYGKERPVGSGLGLAIVKQLVQAMGGEVGLRTEPGAGATFVVTLPSGPKGRRVDDLEVRATQPT
jgi:signal transduction histidine kinase